MAYSFQPIGADLLRALVSRLQSSPMQSTLQPMPSPSLQPMPSPSLQPIPGAIPQPQPSRLMYQSPQPMSLPPGVMRAPGLGGNLPPGLSRFTGMQRTPEWLNSLFGQAQQRRPKPKKMAQPQQPQQGLSRFTG